MAEGRIRERSGQVLAVFATADAPVLDGGQHCSGVLRVVMRSAIGREMGIAPSGDVVVNPVFLAGMSDDHGLLIRVANLAAAVADAVEAVEGDLKASLQIEARIVAEVAREVGN